MNSIYVGPTSDKPSFSWVAKDVFDIVEEEFNIVYFKAFNEIPTSYDGLVFIIKEMPPLSFFIKNWRSKKIYVPVDFFKSETHLKNTLTTLSLFDRIAVHNDLLKHYLNANKVSNVDHYVKYLVDRKNIQPKYMWIGVVDYIPELLLNLDRYPVLWQFPHVFLTDLAHLKHSLNSVLAKMASTQQQYEVKVSEDKIFIGKFCFQQWTESSQKAALESAEFAVDFKSEHFYHSTKPPTKVQVYLANDVPVFVNDTHYAIDYLGKLNIDCLTMSDFSYPLSPKALRRHSSTVRELWSVEAIAKQYIKVAKLTLTQKRKSLSSYAFTVSSLMFKKLKKLVQSGWNKSQ
ncbi:hypothetical protein D210916BOD24_07900 [Alteromonas sp. D210916BOD_24]|uniref:hypothetical protein n=1 Tax=Alteromonas sp. D210916BOD_24 TaxID=3157618 RepID=UPI00399C9249